MCEKSSEKFFRPRFAGMRLRAGFGAKSLNVFSDSLSAAVAAGFTTITPVPGVIPSIAAFSALVLSAFALGGCTCIISMLASEKNA